MILYLSLLVRSFLLILLAINIAGNNNNKQNIYVPTVAALGTSLGGGGDRTFAPPPVRRPRKYNKKLGIFFWGGDRTFAPPQSAAPAYLPTYLHTYLPTYLHIYPTYLPILHQGRRTALKSLRPNS